MQHVTMGIEEMTGGDMNTASQAAGGVHTQ